MATPRHLGLREGEQSEFTILAKVKPGQAAAARERAVWSMGPDRAPLRAEGMREVGTVHNYRGVFLDNDTRFLFASVFDGTWDAYLEDFGASPLFTEAFDQGFKYLEGYPGMKDPKIKDWFAANQVPASYFASSYPDLTVRQILKLQRLGEAFQAVLDSPAFQGALKDPANAALMATPAFQKLLDEGSS